ncbi:hypothetical protein N9N03_02085 [Chlamydiia bacterium]|nr:hypothetical protein [Chlamydiia bacterium]
MLGTELNKKTTHYLHIKQICLSTNDIQIINENDTSNIIRMIQL